MDTKEPSAEESKPQVANAAAPVPAPQPTPQDVTFANDVAGIKAEDDVKPDAPHVIEKPVRTHNTTIVAVSMAIVVALGLGGIGAMAYTNAKKKVQPASKTETVSPTPKVSSDDVQKTVDDINSSIKTINDDEDFGETDLSDATLGLQ